MRSRASSLLTTAACSGGGLFRVHLGPYARRSDAEKAAERIRQTVGYKPAFVTR